MTRAQLLGLWAAGSLLPCAFGTQKSGDWPAFVWRLENPAGAISEELAAAFGGVNVEGADEAEWALAQGLDFFVGHGPGRDALHIDNHTSWYKELWQEYWDERDARQLVRQLCLSEAQTMQDLERRLAASLRARKGNTGRGLSLGDEVGLTRYGGPLDLCESKACRAAFSEFLAESARWRALVPEEGAALLYPSTDEVRKAWTAGDANLVAAWMARREFHHRVFLGVLKRLAAKGRAMAPGVPLGLLGLGGRTAFGGIGVDTILPELDFLEPYPALDTRELCFTLRTPEQEAWCTVFAEEGQPAGVGWQVREHWLRGGDALVLWSDRELAADATYFAAARDAVAEVRRLTRELPGWRPATGGLALVHDPRAQALGFLRDALRDGPTWLKRFSSYQDLHGTREVLQRGILRLAEDAGLLPGALPFERIDRETRLRFPVLVLVEQIVIEDDDLARLETYLRAGGRVVVLGDFDLWNLCGEPSDGAAFERLKAAGEARVSRVEFDAARYLAEREGAPQAFGTDCLRIIEGVLRAAGAARPAWRPHAEGASLPWLLAEMPGEQIGERFAAALPNLQDPLRRAAFKTLQVSLEGLDAERIEWLAPRAPGPDGSVQLRPGEALVFKILSP